MIILASTAAVAATASVVTAYRVSYKASRTSSAKSEVSEILFPSTMEIMSEFERSVKMRAETKIDPVCKRQVKLIREFTDIAAILTAAEAEKATEEEICAALKKYWSIFRRLDNTKQYPAEEIQAAGHAHARALKLQKNEFSREFIITTCWMVDRVFMHRVKRYLDPTYNMRGNLLDYKDEFDKITKTGIAQWEG